MGAEGSWGMVLPPTVAVAPLNSQGQDHWRHNFDDSVNVVSFGFVAIAILISMFLLLAIFERFLRQRSTESGPSTPMDLEEQMVIGGKFLNPSPKVTNEGKSVLVLMPGEQTPTFIAHRAPATCHPEPISWPLHHNNPCFTTINHWL